MRRALVLLLLMVSVAHADSRGDKELAKKLWLSGAADYDLGKYDTAIEKFESAYKLNPDPRILYNLGQAHRQRKEYDEAIRQFKAYLHYSPHAKNRAQVDKIVAELKELASAQKKSNGRPPEGVESPTAQPETAPPAENQEQAAPPPAPPPVVHAQPVTKPVAVPPAPPPPKPVEANHWYQDPLAWTLVGSGLVAAGVGTVLAVHGANLYDQAQTTLDQAEARDRRSSAKTYQTTGDVLLGVGGAVAIAGVAKIVLFRSSSRETPHVSMLVSPSFLAVAGDF